MKDNFNFQRFLDAQAPVYETVLVELKQGEKTSHWMWYIFPQLAGLGRSITAARFAIGSEQEARAYLAHPILGERLTACTQLVLKVCGRNAQQIFGYPDHLKFHSSMTLFNHVAKGNDAFEEAIMKYYKSKADQLTLDLLAAVSAR